MLDPITITGYAWLVTDLSGSETRFDPITGDSSAIDGAEGLGHTRMRLKGMGK